MRAGGWFTASEESAGSQWRYKTGNKKVFKRKCESPRPREALELGAINKLPENIHLGVFFYRNDRSCNPTRNGFHDPPGGDNHLKYQIYCLL